jgi:3-deoxy-manno-octulosonate cytidylyltransferase (CMP-KDO synthetase)
LRKAAVIIPARFTSSRFPGKPLASISGKPMLQWVWEGAGKARLVDRWIVATDDERIRKAAAKFGAEAIMTSSHHGTGTERAAEVARALKHPVIVNVQGDEPLVSGEMIDRLVETLQDKTEKMVSLMSRISDLEFIDDPHVVKVITDRQGRALYFSRSPLPYRPDDFFYHHIGIYGYQREFLLQYPSLPASRLERVEKLEQLRALENGLQIKMIEISHPGLRVDTPQDIIKVEEYIRARER